MKNQLVALMLLVSFALPAQTVLNVVFDKLQEPIHVKATGEFQGPTHPRFRQDFTGWSPGKCITTHKLDALGDSIYAIQVLKPGVQFGLSIPELKLKTSYRLSITAKADFVKAPTFYLREVHAPYKGLGQRFEIPMFNTFKTFDFPLRVNHFPRKSDLGLFIHFTYPGLLSLKNIRLTQVSDEEYEILLASKAKIAIRPDPTQPNFLKHSTFPHGLQTGWNQYGKNQAFAGTVTTDPTTLGPSGQPALKLHAPPRFTVGLCSEPFVSHDPQKPITISFDYKGTGDFRASVTNNYWQLSGEKLTPVADQWKRAKITCKIPPDKISATLQIVGTGALHVDAFRVAPEGQGDYRPPAPHEISFTLPETETSLARIQFEDEPPIVHCHVTPPAKDVTVCLRVTDIYGNKTDLPSLSSSSSFLYYSLQPNRFGQYRIEAQAFRAGKPASPLTETVITRLPKPVYWHRDAPNSPFGIHSNQLLSSMRALKAGGFNWNRLHDGGRYLTCWFFMEPKRGTWAFQDEAISQYRRNNIMLYGQLGGAPAWATTLKDTPQHAPRSYPSVYFTPKPEFEPDYQTYCETMTRKYRGVIDDWFIWNEPWGSLFFHHGYDPVSKRYLDWGSMEKTAAYYAHITKLTFLAAKRGNPSCRITGFNTHVSPQWATYLYQQGIYDFCDDIDYHNYFQSLPGYPEDGVGEAIQRAFSGILKHRNPLDKPVIMSEGQAGSPSIEATVPRVGLYRHSICWQNFENYHQIADDNVRFVLSLLANGVRRVFLYTAHGYDDLSTGSALQIMLGADGYPHPGLVAMSAFASRIEDHRFVRIQPLGAHLHAYLFHDARQNHSTAVISSDHSDQATITAASPQLSLADLYGNHSPGAIVFKGHLVYASAKGSPDVLVSHLKTTPLKH